MGLGLEGSPGHILASCEAAYGHMTVTRRPRTTPPLSQLRSLMYRIVYRQSTQLNTILCVAACASALACSCRACYVAKRACSAQPYRCAVQQSRRAQPNPTEHAMSQSARAQPDPHFNPNFVFCTRACNEGTGDMKPTCRSLNMIDSPRRHSTDWFPPSAFNGLVLSTHHTARQTSPVTEHGAGAPEQRKRQDDGRDGGKRERHDPDLHQVPCAAQHINLTLITQTHVYVAPLHSLKAYKKISSPASFPGSRCKPWRYSTALRTGRTAELAAHACKECGRRHHHANSQ